MHLAVPGHGAELVFKIYVRYAVQLHAAEITDILVYQHQMHGACSVTCIRVEYIPGLNFSKR